MTARPAPGRRCPGAPDPRPRWRRTAALLLCGLLLATPLRAQDDSELLAAGRRFLADYGPFLQAPDSDPERAARLAADLPAVIAIQQRRPDRAWLSALGQVAWRLLESGGAAADVVAAQADALRPLLLAPEGPGLGPALDERLVQALLDRGHWGQAEALFDAALPTWSAHGLDTGLLLLRADMRRKQERWSEAVDDLSRAEATLSGETPWQACEAAGIRAQLELAQGRLDQAAVALAAADLALADTRALTGPDHLQTVALAAATELRHVELDLTAGRLELVAARPAPHPDTPADLALTLVLASQAAEAELALRAGDELSGHVHVLERVLTRDDLPESARLMARLQLIELHLAAAAQAQAQAAATSASAPARATKALDRAAAGLATCESELGRWDGPRPPQLEAAMVAVQHSRLARLRADPTQDLRPHLQALTDAWDGLLASWARTPVVPGGLGFLHLGGRRAVLVELVSLAEALHGAPGLELALQALLRGQALGSLARELDLPATDLASVRAHLAGPDGVLLLVLPAIRAGHLLVLSADGLERHDLLPGPALQALSPRRDGRGGDADALARALFPPALRPRLAAASHVSVWGSSWLGEVDLAALPWDAPHTVAGQALALVELPSVPLGVHLARGWPTPVPADATRLALWVAPDPGAAARARWPELVPLPWDSQVASRLGAPFGDGVRPLTASAHDLLSRPLDEQRLLHLLCHGSFDAAQVLPAGLALQPEGPAADGLLSGAALSAPTRSYPAVVLLSVCGAARGPRRLGDDGARHLGGAFLRGGARLVLLADGSLPFGPTVALLEVLTRELADGVSPAEALRRARRATGQGLGLRWFGVAHRPLFVARESSTRAAWWLLPVLLVVLLASRRRRRRD